MTLDYLIWSHEHGAWWGPGGRGYVRSMSKAGRYSQAEAISRCVKAMPGTSAWMGAMPELPVRLVDVEQMRDVFQTEHPGRVEGWE